MELSAIDSYARKPHADNFPVGDDFLPVEWDKAVFTGRFIASLYDEMKRGQREVLAQIKVLDDELKAAGDGEAADEKASELTGSIIHLRAEVEEIEHRVYSRALADKVLLSWGMTNGGVPVPATFDVLMSKPKEFVADLFNFCRQKSLPEVAEKKTETLTGATRTTRATSRSSSRETRTTRRRKGQQRSVTPTSSPSPTCADAPSSNTTPG